MNAVDSPSSASRNRNKWVILFVIILAVTMLILACVGYIIIKRRNRGRARRQSTTSLSLTIFEDCKLNSITLCGLIYGLILNSLLTAIQESNNSSHDPGSSGLATGNALELSQGNDFELPLLDLGTIASATENFSADNKLGEGGFGPVYKVISVSIFFSSFFFLRKTKSYI